MEKVQLLTIGREPVLLQKLSRFINENPKWESTATVNDEAAIELFHQRKYDFVLFIDTIQQESENKLRKVFTFYDADINFIQHHGDETGLLASEIQDALDKRNYLRNKIIDNVFKPGDDE